MSSETTLRLTARAIRPYLSELLDERDAVELDRALAEILCSEARSEGEVEKEIGRLLMSHAETHRWSAAFLERRRPPDELSSERGYASLPGDGQPVTFARYACPHGDFDWYRRAVGVEIPDCPTHGCALEPAGAEEGG